MEKIYPYFVIDSFTEIPFTDVSIVGIEMKSIFSGDEVIVTVPITLREFDSYTEAKSFLVNEVSKALKFKVFKKEVFKHPHSPDFKKTFSCYGGDGYYVCVADDKKLGFYETLKKADEILERYVSETYPIERELSEKVSKITGLKINVEINDSRNIAKACYTVSEKSFYLFSRLSNGEYLLHLGADLIPYPDVLKTFSLVPALLMLYTEGKMEFTDKKVLEIPPISGNVIGEDRIKRAVANAYAIFVASSSLGTSEKTAEFFKNKVLPEYKISENAPEEVQIANAISKLQIFLYLHLCGFLTEKDFKYCTRIEKEFIESFLKV